MNVVLLMLSYLSQGPTTSIMTLQTTLFHSSFNFNFLGVMFYQNSIEFITKKQLLIRSV